MCELNDLDRTGGIDRENGKYHTRTFVNAERVPLVKFTGITDTPHTYTPEFAQLYWDTFSATSAENPTERSFIQTKRF